MAIGGKFDKTAIGRHVVVIMVLVLFLLGVKFVMSYNTNKKNVETTDTSVVTTLPVDSTATSKDGVKDIEASSEIKVDNTICSSNYSNAVDAILITGDNVRVRSEASTLSSSNILFKLGKEDIAIVIGKTTNQNGELWYNICFEDFTGWVIGKYGKLFQMNSDSKSIMERTVEGRTKIIKMVFREYSEGDYPHLIFKELEGTAEYDFRFLNDNNYDGLSLLLEDQEASFGFKANPKLLGEIFLISAKKKEVLDDDLDGNSFKSKEWCITSIRRIEN